MKVKGLLMAMAALSMVGCSQNEMTEMESDTNRPIGLDVYTKAQTKGAETTTDALKKVTGIGIFAYQTNKDGWDGVKDDATPDFMYNANAKWNNNTWEYTPLRFWPVDDQKLTFFAYAPYESSPADGKNQGITLSAKDAKGAPAITFEVNKDYSKMVDLVIDRRDNIKNQTSASNASNSGTVQFKFSHVLTQVANVMVKPDVNLGNDTKIFVTGLKLATGSNILYDKAVYQFSDNKWNVAEPASYFSVDYELDEILNLTIANQWGYKTNSIEASDLNSATDLFKKDQALYFIPVTNTSEDGKVTTGTAKAGDLKLKISYDLVTKVDENNHLVSRVINKEVNLPVGTFKQGTKHTYTLTIQMNAIKIAVDDNMEAWADGGNTGIE